MSVLSKSEFPKEDSEITLEMSQIMNKNLQALLEDTLLKNVALKVSIAFHSFSYLLLDLIKFCFRKMLIHWHQK